MPLTSSWETTCSDFGVCLEKCLEKVTAALAAEGFRAPRKTAVPDARSERGAGFRLYILFEVENATGEHRSVVAQLEGLPAVRRHVAGSLKSSPRTRAPR
ncbi:MAG TPA: hypothetical protein VEO02_08540 [Thermoanaerobaculia bacterium]|nr:hypothetical protein [Thermoanaerobaculia bacterium]